MKPENPPFKKGDKVTTKFDARHEHVVREITSCVEDKSCGSGWRASCTAGDPCPHCDRPYGQGVGGIDANWFVKVKEVAE